MEGSNCWGYGCRTQHSYPRSRWITWRRPEVKFGRNVVKEKKNKKKNYQMRTKSPNKWELVLCWTCLEICLELPKSRYLISYKAIWWINSKVPEGSIITSKNNSVARESSRVSILKSRLNSTSHSACTSEVRDIFVRQTHVPNDRWCARAFFNLDTAAIQWRRPSVILQLI